MNDELYVQSCAVMEELIQKAKLQPGSLVVIGCSTSEIGGATIGTDSSPKMAQQVFSGLYETAKKHQIYLAFQCCEHLNRAIVLEKEAALGLEQVNVVPQPKAGGSMATCAYSSLENPVVVEEIKADAGLDIGFTLIGMHLKKVAVPLRLEQGKIGCATVLAARTRPKFIGGERAAYNSEWL
jgi:uncharacterized protein (TIGR01440 family)